MKGYAGKVQRRLEWYGRRAAANPRYQWLFGKYVEARGNNVTIDGLRFSVATPGVLTEMKRYFLFDQYEKPEREVIRKHLDPDLPVIEFGGSLGVVACHTNRMLRNPTRHVVVEANPELIPLLERNRASNNCQFTVVNRALGYDGRELEFHINSHFWASNTTINTGNSVQVPTISLASLIKDCGFERCTVISDTEGAEIDLVQNEAATLREHAAMFIVEVHPWCVQPEVTSKMMKNLEEIGFALVERNAENLAYKNTSDAFARQPLLAANE